MRRDVQLRIATRLPQRLLRQAAAEGICISEARCEEDGLRVCLGPSDARAMRALCGRFGLAVETESLRGGGAMMAFLKRRATLAVSALSFLLVAALLLGHIWRVDIEFTGSAAELGDAAAVRGALDELGVRPGIPAALDTGRLESALSTRLPGFSFIGVRRQGVRLVVSAAPEAPAPELYALDAARDLCARQAGIVVSVSVRAGEACVRPGDAVRRGQLLIRGEEKARGDASRPIAALGEVVIRTWFTGEARLPTRAALIRRTGNTSVATNLKVLDWEFPIAVGRCFARQVVESESLPIGGLFIPVELRRDVIREVREETVAVDGGALEARLAALALADAAAHMARETAGAYEVTRRWLEYEDSGRGTMTAHAVIEITTDAAVPREALYLGG